jgi:hypothetical protein
MTGWVRPDSDYREPLLGTSLLHLALFVYVVAQFHAWGLGAAAFVVAMLLNAVHVLLRKTKS